MGKHANSVDSRILKYIQAKEPGWVFTPSDLSEFGSRTAVATALTRHRAAGRIRPFARGLYDLPRKPDRGPHPLPSIDAVVAAIQGRDAVKLQPTGAYAANLLGLSDQVPMRVVFLTDGGARKIRMGNLEISFRHTTPKNMAGAGRASGMVIQALRWLGKDSVADAVLRLRKSLDSDAKGQLLADLRFAPAWVAQAMREIALVGVK